MLQTLSLWQNLELVFMFAYHGIHAEALSKRSDWFVHGKWPTYVAWRADDTHIPMWQEAYERYEQFQRDGSQLSAFSIKQPFAPNGEPTSVDRVRAKEIATAMMEATS